MDGRRRKPQKWIGIAKERIQILFEQAKKAGTQARSDRYVFLARKIAMRYNIHIPKELKRRFCKKCGHHFAHNGDVVVRTNPKTKAVEYLCKGCGKITRYGYGREK